MGARLREVGRFNLGKTVSNPKEKQFLNSVWVKSVISYVTNRQNGDGGYAFCQEMDSNAQDTYYGLSILDLLKTPFPNIKQTIKWLHDFVPDSYYSHYYVSKALELCGEYPDKKLCDFLLSFQCSNGKVGTVDVYVEVASEFEVTLMITELVNLADVETDREKTIDRLLSCQNKDGGFGAHSHSNLNSTYHAIASLSNLGYPVKSLKKVLGYVRSCEKPSGGFTVVPNSSYPYMEHTYYGAMTLDLLEENCRFPSQTTDFILRCQNANGGFARADLGISTFENTFQAASVLQKLGFIESGTTIH